MGARRHLRYTGEMNSDKMFGKRNKLRPGYVFSGIAVFILLSGINAVIFRGARLNNRYTGRIIVERKINDYITSLRGVGSVSEIIEITENNSDILGIGTYDSAGESISIIGSGFQSLEPSELFRGEPIDREYIENKKNSSVIVIIKPPKPPRGPRPPNTETESTIGDHLVFRYLLSGAYTFFEIKLVRFWNRARLLKILFPVTEIVIAIFAWLLLRLVRNNGEYRKKIEEQKNLVILGTAAGTLAHEIKNPLSAIRLQTSIIERSRGKTNRDEIDIINSEVDRLTALAKHVTDYLRDPAGNPESIIPGEITEQIFSRIIGRSANLTDKKFAEGNSISVYCDRERYRSIIENILLNAVESGGRHEDIEVELKQQNEYVLISVKDRGKGVPPEQIERLFDPFYTTKSSGTGVGLAIAKRFTEAAGGSISVANRSGGGIKVTIKLSSSSAGQKETQ